MAQFDRAAADAILKEDYLPPVREQLNLATPYLAELQRNTKDVVGKEAYVPLHTARSEAVGARAENGDLPTAQFQGYKESTFFVTYQYGRIEVNLPTIESTKSNKGAFLRAVDSETKGVLSELKEDFDRQLLVNDENGAGTLAVCDTTTASTTVQLKDTTDATWRYVRVGLYIDIHDKDDAEGVAALESNRQITAVDKANETITISGAAVTTTADEHVIVRTGNWKHEMRGLPGITKDTGTLQGVDPASYPVWKASVLENGGVGRALSEDLLQQLVDAVGIESGEEPDAFVVEHTQRRKFYGLMSSMKRAVNTLELKGGFKALTFNDSIPFLVDRFYDPTKIAAINRKHQSLYEMSDWKWADNDGAVLSRVSGKPSFEAFLFKFANLGTDRRNAFGVLEDLNV